MTIITQDGRRLEVSGEYDLLISGYSKSREHKATIKIATFTKSKWDDIPYSERHKYPDYEAFPERELVMRYGVIGEYATDTGRRQVADALWQAWKYGAEEFIMPPDYYGKSAFEEIEDFCQEHKLIMAGLDELGYTAGQKAIGRELALTSDYWEKRGVIVSDDYGDYSASLANWQAIAAGNAQKNKPLESGVEKSASAE